MRWERVKISRKSKETPEGKKSPGRKGGTLGPGKRWGHTCNSVKGGRFLYVFGGYGKDNCQTNDVHVFDTIKQTWSKPVMKGAPPSPRDSHTCTTVGSNLFVFGGTDGKNPLNDLHVLDTTANTWIQPHVSGDVPDAREGHSAALVGKRLFIFGGCGKSRDDPEVYYNDLYILDTETFIWEHGLTIGAPPSARESHTCSSWKNKVIVLGGEDASDYYLSDVYVLDSDTLVWRKLKTSGQVLTPRAGHSTVALGKYLFVFGGFTDDRNLYDDLHVLNIDTGIWSKISNASEGPSARFSVAGDCLDPRKGMLIFIGGCNENLEALDDMYYLHTEMSVENGYDHKPEKLSLRKELKRKQQEHYLSSTKEVAEDDKIPDLLTPFSSLKHGQTGVENNSFCNAKPAEKNIFEATITDILQCGYKIETTIDGKPLRGIIFSSSPSFSYCNAHRRRKRMSKERHGAGRKGNNRRDTEFDEVVKSEDQGVDTNLEAPNIRESAVENLLLLSSGSTPKPNLIPEKTDPLPQFCLALEPETAATLKEVPSQNHAL